MFTSIVIPTFNNYGQLADCIQSINDHSQGHEYEIIIMDNGPQPLGYTDPCVRGMQAARGELICVINDDCLVTEGWLPPLIEAAESGAWVFSPDHPDDQGRALGWFLCFSRQGYQALGGFDSQFLVWCADVDIFKRCEQHGKDVFRIPESHVEHLEYSSTTNREGVKEIVAPWQAADLQRYRAKWGTDPNIDKLQNASRYLQS
jgi:GT2 family glycosyltransferase